jgi:hypothetical protein
VTVNLQWGLGLTTTELVATCSALERFCDEHGHDESDMIDALEPALHELQRRRDKALSREVLDVLLAS